MSNVISIPIKDIDLTHSPDFRESLREDRISDYKKRYDEDMPMLPITVYKIDGIYYLADGRHRLEALKQLGRSECFAEIQEGNENDLWGAAINLNDIHGTQWSKAEKHMIIKKIARRFPQMSNREIAGFCGFSHTYVNEVMSISISSPKSGNGFHPTTQPIDNQSRCMGVNSKKTLDTSSGTQTAMSVPPGSPKPPLKLPIVLDDFGYPVPKESQPMLARKSEIKEYINRLHAMLRELEMVSGNGDLLWRGFDIQSFKQDIEQAVFELERAFPAHLCPQCQGRVNAVKCDLCKGKGFVSDWIWKSPVVTMETREIRAKIIEKNRVRS